MFRLKLKSEMTGGIYSDLVKNNFPNPNEYPRSIISENYFRTISTDTGINCETRLVAKEILTIMDNVTKLDGVQAYLQWEKAGARALEEYSDYFKNGVNSLSLTNNKKAQSGKGE